MIIFGDFQLERDRPSDRLTDRASYRGAMAHLIKWRGTYIMNEMSFHVISNIFCDFQLERDRPTDRQTDRASYRGAMAHLKMPSNESNPSIVAFLED